MYKDGIKIYPKRLNRRRAGSSMQIKKTREVNHMALAATFIGIVVVCGLVYLLMEAVDKNRKKK